MNEDLYNILGIKRDASDEDIKKAYRQMAKQYHPDLGGHQETFLKIQLAYDILSDLNKRKTYDESGIIDDNNEINIELQSIRVLVEVFGSAINERLNRYNVSWTKFNNLITFINGVLISKISSKKVDIKENEKLKKYLENELKKFKCKNENRNIFNIVLSRKIVDVNKEISGIQTEIKIFEKSLEILKDYTYEDSLMDKMLGMMPVDMYLSELRKESETFEKI